MQNILRIAICKLTLRSPQRTCLWHSSKQRTVPGTQATRTRKHPQLFGVSFLKNPRNNLHMIRVRGLHFYRWAYRNIFLRFTSLSPKARQSTPVIRRRKHILA